MQTYYPHKRLYKYNCACLTVVFVVLAFLISLVIVVFSVQWFLVVAVWLALFLLCWLWYLPQRSKNMSLSITTEKITMHIGIFVRKIQVLPLGSIQFVSVWQNPLQRLLKICSLHIVAPGGKLVFPGLLNKSAEKLVDFINNNGKAE